MSIRALGTSSVLLPVLVALGLWLGHYLFRLKGRRSGLAYPPGPRPRFLLGNLLDIPKTDGAERYAEWGRKLNSDILHFSALGKHILVVNSRRLAEELLEDPKKGALYDDRPQFPTLDVVGWEYNISLMRYGDFWRRHRKVCQTKFNRRAAEGYRPIISRAVYECLKGLLVDPINWSEQVKMMSISVTLSMMYGYTPKSLDDPIIKAGEEALLTGAHLVTPGGSIINMVPTLRLIPPWVPGARPQKLAAHVKRLTEDMQNIPLKHAEEAMRRGTASSSLVTDYLEGIDQGKPEKEDAKIINNIAHTVYGAASDTTISATSSAVFYLANHPEVVQRAQNELDAVIGKGRLPDFSDRPSLPYVDAIYREVLRLCPPVRLSVPHASTEDDIFEGFFIPKGTIVMPNVWAMNRDERIYSDPNEFKPERYLRADGSLNDDSRIYAFGFGRRHCVGKYIASDTVFIIIACLLACFNVGKSQDESGRDIEIKGEWIDFAGLSHIVPFQCKIDPRSAETRRLLEDGWITK